MLEDLPPETFTQLAEALEKGRMIDAIKIYRDATGLDLKQSKDAIDSLYAELQKQDPDRFPERKQTVGCGSSAAAITVLLVTALCFAFPT